MVDVCDSAGSSSSQEAAPQQQQQPMQQQPAYYPQQQQGPSEPTGPCSWEIKQFLQCSQQQHDLTLCEGFNEALRQCRANQTSTFM